MICPKCHSPNKSGEKECVSCGVIFSDIRSGRNSAPTPNLDCLWNDHGVVCGERGSMSEGTLGYGPWYCSKHFWMLKGGVRD